MMQTVNTYKNNANQTLVNAWDKDYDICLNRLQNDMEG